MGHDGSVQAPLSRALLHIRPTVDQYRCQRVPHRYLSLRPL